MNNERELKLQEIHEAYENELAREFPARNKIFDCATKFQALGEYNEAIDIYLAMGARGYREQEAYLNIARCYFAKVNYILATQYIDSCLAIDAQYPEAIALKNTMQEKINSDGRFFLKGLAAAVACVSGFLVYRHTHKSPTLIQNQLPQFRMRM